MVEAYTKADCTIHKVTKKAFLISIERSAMVRHGEQHPMKDLHSNEILTPTAFVAEGCKLHIGWTALYHEGFIAYERGLTKKKEQALDRLMIFTDLLREASLITLTQNRIGELHYKYFFKKLEPWDATVLNTIAADLEERKQFKADWLLESWASQLRR